MTSIKSSYISDIKGKSGGIVRAAMNNFGHWGGGAARSDWIKIFVH
jgi:hypothetical protein